MTRPPRRRTFLYIADPVCLVSIAIYLLNRFLIKPYWGTIPFTRDYLNDVLCLPIFLPLVLLMQRGIGIRRHDRPPGAGEIWFHLVIWSIYFEGIAPLMREVYRTTADPRDVAAYALGALIAGWVWGSWKRTSRGETSLIVDASPFPAAAPTGLSH